MRAADQASRKPCAGVVIAGVGAWSEILRGLYEPDTPSQEGAAGDAVCVTGGSEGVRQPAVDQKSALPTWAYRPLGWARKSGSVPNSTARVPRPDTPDTTAG